MHERNGSAISVETYQVSVATATAQANAGATARLTLSQFAQPCARSGPSRAGSDRCADSRLGARCAGNPEPVDQEQQRDNQSRQPDDLGDEDRSRPTHCRQVVGQQLEQKLAWLR